MICKEGIDLICEFEGYLQPLHDGTDRVRPYRDPVGIATIGYGSIWRMDGTRVQMSDPPITREQAKALMGRELEQNEADCVKMTTVALHPLMLAAIVSFSFNLGTGCYRASTLRHLVNAKDWDSAKIKDAFGRYRLAGGRILPGLVRRRAAEAAMFMKGVRLQQAEAKNTKPDIPVVKTDAVKTAIVPPTTKPTVPTRPQIGFGRLFAWLFGRK